MQKILNNANFSGFNIKYERGGFALLFLAEYGRISFISFYKYNGSSAKL